MNFPNSFGKNADLIKHELTRSEMLLLVNIVLILRLWLQCNLNFLKKLHQIHRVGATYIFIYFWPLDYVSCDCDQIWPGNQRGSRNSKQPRNITALTMPTVGDAAH